MVGDELMAQLRDRDDEDEIEEELQPAGTTVAVGIGRRQQPRRNKPPLAQVRSLTRRDAHSTPS
jgi:hypothetical protein